MGGMESGWKRMDRVRIVLDIAVGKFIKPLLPFLLILPLISLLLLLDAWI